METLSSNTNGDKPMPITRVEVDEYQCARCSYKWISRVNGKDRPKPQRCAKCKSLDWNEGYGNVRTKYIYKIRKRFGYWFVGGLNQGGWRTEEIADQFLKLRPSVQDIKLVLKPLCFLYKNKLGDDVVVKYENGKPTRTYDMPSDVDIKKEVGRQLMKHMIDTCPLLTSH